VYFAPGETAEVTDGRVRRTAERKRGLASENTDSPVDEIGLEAAVEQLVWDYLYDNHGGWENNDGALGTFEFSVPDRTIALQHNERYTDVNTTTHKF
jgi:hypothetical protein